MARKQSVDVKRVGDEGTALARVSHGHVKLPEKWELRDYHNSVNYMRPMIEKYAGPICEIASELYIARSVLSAQGRRSDLGAHAPKLPTWEQYCKDIGISKSQANRQIAAQFKPAKKVKSVPGSLSRENRHQCPTCKGKGYLTDEQLGEDIIEAEVITRPKAFRSLTAKMVSEYAKSIKFDLDGQVFLDFYDSKGWVVGKTKMKDWKAAVRTWKSRRNGTAKDNATRGRQPVKRAFDYTGEHEGVVVGDD